MNVQNAVGDCKGAIAPAEYPDTEFLLCALRAATLRAKLAAVELDTIGISLRKGLVSCEGALAWLHDLNLFDHVLYRQESAA